MPEEIGSWWAARLIPVDPPGPLYPWSMSGRETLSACVVAARRLRTGRWAWCVLTPAAREIFATVLDSIADADPDSWYYILEIDDAVPVESPGGCSCGSLDG
jgi:hypothetical protein